MRIIVFLIFGTLAAPAHAASLCGVTDPVRLYEALGTLWAPEQPRLSLENETTSILRDGPSDEVTISPAGTYDSTFTDSLTGAPLDLTLAEARPYDVDGVDDMLDTTENAVLADILSDTPCGPEDLPQFVAEIPATEGMSAGGTITLIAYFDDRVLRIMKLELKSEETILFLTETALLRPALQN